jgi:hypothetical protein
VMSRTSIAPSESSLTVKENTVDADGTRQCRRVSEQ